MPLNDIVYIEFYSTDFEKFKKFYSIFGWKMKPSGDDYLMFDTPKGFSGGIYLAKEPKPNMNMFIYVMADDIIKYLESAKNVGWIVEKEKKLIPGIGFYAVLKDFDGNVISLFETLPENK